MDWHDKSIPLFVVTIAMIVLPLVVVPLRCYVRITRRSFKIDDWLIIVALLFHLGACATTLWGFMYGLAMPDKVLTEENRLKGVQPIYTIATGLIKCSICYTFLRLSTAPKVRRSLHWIIIIVSISSLVMFVGSFVYCVPYAAIWTHWQHPHTPGYCLPGAVVLTVGYAFACITIITDFACAIIPDGLGRILLFELLECGLGIFASCAPALKPWLSASITSFTSLLHRLTRWTTLGSSISSSCSRQNQDLEKGPPDTVMDSVMDAQDNKAWDDYEHERSGSGRSNVPVIIVSRVRPESGDYTNTWNVSRAEDD
ncbi:unnamed protein product [Aureobasidium pullulans]|nr:unnamed protein product [Aureobasidium pullulans]